MGFDIGTLCTKMGLFDECDNTIATATYGYELYQPKVGWAEQNPEDWWKTCVTGMSDIIYRS